MPHIERTAHVGWDGNLARGAGTLDAESGAFARLPFSLPSRVGDPGGRIDSSRPRGGSPAVRAAARWASVIFSMS